MNVHLVNPSHVSFGTSVITPRWLYVLAGATPASFGNPIIVDETFTALDPSSIRHWLIPQAQRPKVFSPHPVMSTEEIRRRTQAVWERFYSLGSIWKRSRFLKSLRGRLTFILISKIYRQMYADTGIATDSARVARSARWARWLAKPCRYLFSARPMPELQKPKPILLDV